MAADTTRSDGGSARLEDVTGRTPWDVLAILVGKLGVPLLVLFAIGAAVYFFVQQQNDARRDVDQARLEATKAAEAALEAAREKLITTYDKLGTLSEQQIGNIQKVLTLNQAVTQDLEAQRGKLDVLQDQISKSEMELAQAKQEVESLRREQAQANLALEGARTAMAAQQTELEGRKKEIELLATQLAERESRVTAQQAQIDQQLANIGSLKNDVTLLAKDVYGSAKSEETAALARRVVEETPSDILMAAAEAPSPDTVGRLDSLIGVPVSTFETGLREGKHGYGTWLRATTPGEKHQSYIGVGTADSKNAKLSRAIWLETDGALISSIDPPIGDVVLLRLNNPEQWFGQTDYLIGRFEPEPKFEVINEYPANNENVWSFRGLIMRETPGTEVAVAHGGPSPTLNVLDATTLKRDYPEIARALAETPAFGLAMAMAERAQAFDTSRLDLRAVEPSFPEVAEALRRIIAAGIARDAERLAPLVGPPLRAEDGGRVAALALRARFEVVGALDVTELVRAEAQAAKLRQATPYQQAPMGDKAPLPEPETAQITRYVDVSLRYLQGEGADARSAEATLRFEQKTGDPLWRLTDVKTRSAAAAAY